MKTLNIFSKLCSPSVGSLSSDVGFDGRLTVGSPSGFNSKLMLKLVSVLAILLTIGVGQMWGSEITLVATDFATNNGYFTSEQTFTKTVQFGYIYAYQSNANNTPTGWAKNQAVPMKGHASQNGKIYNKAAISTISNIRVYVVVNTNSFTVSYGTTTACDAGSITRPATATGTQSITYTSYNSGSKTTTAGQSTTATYYDFDLSAANPTYFKISNGSSALYIWKIVITYSAAPACGAPTSPIKGSFSNEHHFVSPKPFVKHQVQHNANPEVKPYQSRIPHHLIYTMYISRDFGYVLFRRFLHKPAFLGLFCLLFMLILFSLCQRSFVSFETLCSQAVSPA